MSVTLARLPEPAELARSKVLHARSPHRPDLSLCGVYGITAFAETSDAVTCKRCLVRLEDQNVSL